MKLLGPWHMTNGEERTGITNGGCDGITNEGDIPIIGDPGSGGVKWWITNDGGEPEGS